MNHNETENKERDIQLIPYEEADIPRLTEIMIGAFNYDAQIHLGRENGGPEGYDDGTFLRNFGFHKDSSQYKVLLGDQIVGGVILWINEKTQENSLGCLFMDVTMQNKGLGLAVWNKVEERYPNTVVWRTDTPAFSRRNHHFYINKCKFHVVRIEHPESLEQGSYLMEKRMK